MKIQNSKFKILKRFLPKFLTLVFMLGVFSCQKDDSFNESDHPTVSKDNHEVSTRKLTLHDLNQKQFLNESLAKMESVLDINKTQDGNAKIIATDGSFTVLTDEIIECITSTSVSYSFLTESPINPHADYENLVLFKKGDEPFKFYLYSYKTIFYNGTWENHFISRLLIDGETY